MVSDFPVVFLCSVRLKVLILVLMEYGLWLKSLETLENDERLVLILVLMEYGLWQISAYGTV